MNGGEIMKKRTIGCAVALCMLTMLFGCGTNVEGASVIVSSQNEKTITSTINTVDDAVVKSYAIDQQIQKELEEGNHTWSEPYVIQNPFHNSPLTAIILFQTDEEVKVRVTVKGDSEQVDVSGEADAATNHRVPVVGLYAGRDNQVQLDLLDGSGNVTDSKTLTITTDELPSSMTDMVEVKTSKAASSYGLIEASGFGTPHPYAFDQNGDVRWYLSDHYASYGMFPISNNHFLMVSKESYVPTEEKPHTQAMYEMDELGRVYNVYWVQNGIHHDVIEMTPGGNFLLLSSSIDGHVEDVVTEISRETGAVIKSLDMRKIFGETYVDMVDWAHLNTCSYDEETDTILLSPRNVHSGIRVKWSTDELEWILADPAFWKGTPFEHKVLKSVGKITWFYQPHSIYEIEEDLDNNPNTIHIGVFDNHWQKIRKAPSFDNKKKSFVTIYTINEKKRTVKQEKIYSGVKSKITSNYRFNAQANTVFFMGGFLAEETESGQQAMIYEYDFDTADVLNQYALRYTFYRAYEFEPDFHTLSQTQVLEDNHFKGELTNVKKNSKLKVPSQTLNGEVSFTIQNQVLFVKAGDHKLKTVEFIGSFGKKYYYSLSYAGKGAKKYQKLTYNTAVALSGLPKGKYKLVVTYDGTRYKTGETVTVK